MDHHGSLLKRAACLLLAAAIVLAMPTPAHAAKAKSKAKTARKVVIVLDPGHDSTHNGCHYGSFNEEYANLAIAIYCKQELETYKGVSVYLTRSTMDCPYGADPSSSTPCLASRVNFAKAAGATAIVSLHNDYDPDLDTTQCGSKIIIPNPFYRQDICMSSFGLAQSILPQLTATGLTVNNWKLFPGSNGIVMRNSAVSTYPDGTPRDYYALINKSKLAGIPCVIVEHAFCSNPSDLQNHLTTQPQLQQLGIADARGIAAYYGLTK